MQIYKYSHNNRDHVSNNITIEFKFNYTILIGYLCNQHRNIAFYMCAYKLLWICEFLSNSVNESIEFAHLNALLIIVPDFRANFYNCVETLAIHHLFKKNV